MSSSNLIFSMHRIIYLMNYFSYSLISIKFFLKNIFVLTQTSCPCFIFSEIYKPTNSIISRIWKIILYNMPVLFYIHGGGYEIASSQFYPKQPFINFVVSQQIILVMIEYRIGFLGTLKLALFYEANFRIFIRRTVKFCRESGYLGPSDGPQMGGWQHRWIRRKSDGHHDRWELSRVESVSGLTVSKHTRGSFINFKKIW